MTHTLREGINKYLSCEYEDGGRGPVEYDCWGLVRHVRHAEFGLRLLPEYGSLRNNNPKAFTRAYRDESSLMEEGPARHGSVAAVLIGAVCVHVALVVECNDRLHILEINPERGARFLTLKDWLRDHNTVTFHNDRSICQPTGPEA